MSPYLILLPRCKVAGTSHLHRSRRLKVEPGSPVKLKAEPINQYDPFAVQVWFGEVMLGYIPKGLNVAIHQLLTQTVGVDAVVLSADWDDGYFKVMVDVRWDLNAHSA